MKSLKERVQEGMTEEERCDVLLSMVNRIEEGQRIGGSPEEVFLDDDNRVYVKTQGNLPNLAFCPPEMLENQSVSINKAQRWFILGMYAYYMYYKTDFYIQKKTAALVSRSDQKYVIMPADVSEIPFGAAVCDLTALDPEWRVKGLKGFLIYLREKIEKKACILYHLNGKIVGKQEKILEADIEDLWPSGKVTIGKTVHEVLNGPVRIPCRPGTHTYHVQVALAGQTAYTPRTEAGLYLYCDANALIETHAGQDQVQLLNMNSKSCKNRVHTSQGQIQLKICRLAGEGAAPEPVGYVVNVQKPKDYQGASYWIDLSYDPTSKCVGVRLTSESGVTIAPARSVSMATLQ